MYKRKDLPETDDFVIATVKSVSQHAAKFDLDEFKELEGTVNSSEMSRRWSRNIRVFLKPGRKVVCKIMNIDRSAKYANLSIRRVGASQAKTKQDEWNKEKRANELLIALSKSSKIKYETIFDKVGEPILKKYGIIYPFLEQIVIDDSIVKELKLDKKLSSGLIEVSNKRIKLKKARVKGILNLKSTDPNGLEIIKKSLNMLKSSVKDVDGEIEIKYLGAPKYQVIFESSDLKRGGDDFSNILSKIEKYIKKNKGTMKFNKVVV